MSEFCFDIPAVRGIQAGRVFYTINAPFGVLQRLVAFDTGNVLARSQREVNPLRAKKVSQYIQENDSSFVLTSLTGVIDEHPEFIESEHANVGLLKISMDSEILLFDGQHRTTGIIDAIKDDVHLRGHTIPIMLFMDMSLEERQQAFSDINGHTVKPSASLSDTYNSRHALPMLIVDMANTLPVFKNVVDFERNVVGKNSPYLFTVKILKEATAKLMSIKVNEALSDEQKGLAAQFWTECGAKLLWDARRNWVNESAEDFRAQYVSSHGVFLHALGMVGQSLLAQYGNLSKLTDLGSLDIKRRNKTFQGRCIDAVTGNMISNAVAIKLTAIKILCHLGCPVTPELQLLERQYFSDTEFPPINAPQEEVSDVDVSAEPAEDADVATIEPCVHPYADMVRARWVELSEEAVSSQCEDYESVMRGRGFGVEESEAKALVQCIITRLKKPPQSLTTIRRHLDQVIQG
ncbi:DNA sulfur modification protein DndB [Vibrio pectenicida]|uniref:DNA sulfur modification protein DndB n=1 Tax=Vibrio pectenicida TaxID=62763 RepID=UPI003B9AD750